MSHTARSRAARLGLALAAAGGLGACALVTPSDEPGLPAAAPARLGLPVVLERKRPTRLVLVSVHGLSPANYLGQDPSGAMPTLTMLATAGVAAEAVNPVFPASSYPAHTTLITGRVPARHGIASDHLLGEHGVRAERYSHASHVRAITLWQAAADAGRSAAALDWPATRGASIGGLLPDTRPLRRGESWPRLLADSATPWLFDLALQLGAGDAAANQSGAERDAVLGRVACALLESEAPPALLLLRLSQTEGALRRFGPGTPEAREAFAGADAELARLVACLRDADQLASTAIVVVGDHGVGPVHTAVRPNGLLADVGLVVVDDARAVLSWRAIARSNGGSAFVYSRTEEDALLARRALEQAAARTRSFRIVSAEEMLQLGADPEAWFGLEAEPGYVFEDAPAPAPVGIAAVRGSGGYLPANPAMKTGLVAWGPGIRRGVRAPLLDQVDVAPTLARLLGLRLGSVDGRVVVGLINVRDRGEGVRRQAPGG